MTGVVENMAEATFPYFEQTPVFGDGGTIDAAVTDQ